MNNEIMFAQIFGPLFILMGISMIINKKWYMKVFKEVQESCLTIYVLSIIGFIFGMYVLANFSGGGNILEIFATFIGIAVTLKSVFYILTPQVMQKITKQMKPLLKNIHYIGGLYLLLGVYISYISYV